MATIVKTYRTGGGTLVAERGRIDADNSSQVTVTNQGPDTVYYGDSQVTSATGTALTVGASVTLSQTRFFATATDTIRAASLAVHPVAASAASSSNRVVALGNRATDYTLALSGDENVLVTATLTGNWTLAITGQAAGAQVTLELTQDGTGGRVVTLPAGTDPLGSFALDSAAAATSIITLYTPDGTTWRRVKAGAGSLAVGFSSSAAAAGDDTRLRAGQPPKAHSLIAWTWDPLLATGQFNYASNNLMLAKVWLPSPQTITNVLTYVMTAGATLTASGCFAGVYDSTGARIGVTADQSTAWTSTGLKTMALASPISWAGGIDAFLYLALLANGTTTPKIPIKAGNTDATFVNINTAAGAPRSTAVTGQSSLPTSVTLSTATLQNSVPWLAIS